MWLWIKQIRYNVLFVILKQGSDYRSFKILINFEFVLQDEHVLFSNLKHGHDKIRKERCIQKRKVKRRNFIMNHVSFNVQHS